MALIQQTLTEVICSGSNVPHIPLGVRSRYLCDSVNGEKQNVGRHE